MWNITLRMDAQQRAIESAGGTTEHDIFRIDHSSIDNDSSTRRVFAKVALQRGTIVPITDNDGICLTTARRALFPNWAEYLDPLISNQEANTRWKNFLARSAEAIIVKKLPGSSTYIKNEQLYIHVNKDVNIDEEVFSDGSYFLITMRLLGWERRKLRVKKKRIPTEILFNPNKKFVEKYWKKNWASTIALLMSRTTYDLEHVIPADDENGDEDSFIKISMDTLDLEDRLFYICIKDYIRRNHQWKKLWK